MAINKLTEQRERDKGSSKSVLTKGRIVFIGAMQNDLWENSNNSGQPSAINSQKWRKEITNLVKLGCPLKQHESHVDFRESFTTFKFSHGHPKIVGQ